MIAVFNKARFPVRCHEGYVDPAIFVPVIFIGAVHFIVSSIARLNKFKRVTKPAAEMNGRIIVRVNYKFGRYIKPMCAERNCRCN